ncbi:MAG: M23 family metallopeptidase [Elusimicrobia bacterium]|nr:M23 family metallopeptidase [Elusimicrobiota bacterium]
MRWERLFRRIAPALLVLGVAVSVVLAKGRRPPDLHFTVSPSTVTAGRTLTVWLQTSAPLKNPSLTFGGRRAVFYPSENGTWRAFLGVSSLEDAGAKSALFEMEFARHRIFQSTVPFTVEAGKYPSGHVKISKALEQLIAGGQMERDAQVLERFYQRPLSNEKLWSGRFVLPSTGVFSSVYGSRRLYGTGDKPTPHTGLDIANRFGTRVTAANRGVVAYAGWLDSFGHSILLDHGQGIFSYYLHLQKLIVQQGDRVEKGTLLGEMGAKGVATGPHVHWSFVVAGERVDPLEWTEKEFK